MAMDECRYRASWIPEYRCHRRGWLFGRCMAHWLEQWRWECRPLRDWSVSVDLSNLNVPTLRIDEERCPDGRVNWVSFDYGSRGCDPVFSIVWDRDRPSGAE